MNWIDPRKEQPKESGTYLVGLWTSDGGWEHHIGQYDRKTGVWLIPVGRLVADLSEEVRCWCKIEQPGKTFLE